MYRKKELASKLNETSKELDDMLLDIAPDRFNNYKLTENQIIRFIELNKTY